MNTSTLLFARPAFIDFFREVACQLNLNVVSEPFEFKKADKTPLIKEFYKAYRQGHASVRLSHLEVLDVIRRDRVLRILPSTQAEAMVHAMDTAIAHLLNTVSPKLILSVPVDNYIRDLFRKQTKSLQIPHVAFGGFFINGYARTYHRQEHEPWRIPNKDEVHCALDALIRPDYQVTPAVPPSLRGFYSAPRHIKRHAIFRAKKFLYLLKAIKEQDPLNWEYHSVKVARDRKRLLDFRCMKYFPNTLDLSKRKNKKMVYMPLHVIPEGTIDYWVKDSSFLAYEEQCIELLKNLSQKYECVVKEHPGMLGCRQLDFYQRLTALPGVSLAPLGCLSNDILTSADAVVSWSSSVGLEAALRGKVVALVEQPYYMDTQACWVSIDSQDAFKNVATSIEHALENYQASSLNKEALMSHALSTSIPAKFDAEGFKAPSNIQKFVSGIRPLIELKLQ